MSVTPVSQNIDPNAPIHIRRALISVSDKTGLIDLAQALVAQGIELVSTGGTHKALAEAGLKPLEISELTGFPEGLGGRVKTLHPFVHGGLLARRGLPDDEQFVAENLIPWIDLLICNLYPFEKVTSDPNCPWDTAIENIDIGGPAMVRSASKNHAHVAVLTDAGQYSAFAAEITQGKGTVSRSTCRRLAIEAFIRIASYDVAIARYVACVQNVETGRLLLDLPEISKLRYGENPHQAASLYGTRQPGTLAASTVLHGKEISYNNWLDLDAAWSIVCGMEAPSATVIKHTNPCGAAVADNLEKAFLAAYDADPISAYGGIVGLNREVDAGTAEAMALPGRFLECIVAPSFSAEAMQILTTKPTWKKNVRLVAVGAIQPREGYPIEFRSIDGGVLAQTRDLANEGTAGWKTTSKKQPNHEEMRDLALAWKIVAQVKSNAIVLVRDGSLVGVGQGQTSRVESVKLAIAKAGDLAQGAVLGSDAFFPFRDGVDEALRAGVRAFVQPGGSMRDADSVAACDEADATMIFTGIRHFKH